MRKVILHIGSHKTGTTSIQVSLDLSREMLKTYSVFLPPPAPTFLKKNHADYATAQRYRSHGNFADIAYFFRGDYLRSMTKNAQTLVQSELSIQDGTTLILSSEDFATLNSKQVQKFREAFPDDQIEFHLIYFLRHQPESLVGIYQTSLEHKPRFQTTFNAFVAHNKSIFKYDEIIERWNASFHFVSTNLANYINAENGMPVNSIQEFNRILNRVLDTDLDLKSVGPQNRGMGAMTLRWLDGLHPHLSPDSRAALIQFISSLDPKTERQVQFLTTKEFSDLSKAYAINNNSIYKKYNFKLTEPHKVTKFRLLKSRPKLGELFEQLIASNKALFKPFSTDPHIRLIDEDKTFGNPYALLDTAAIKKSVATSLDTVQVVGSTLVPKFPTSVERERDGSNEVSDIENNLAHLAIIQSVVEGASRIVHLGCKWGHMTRLLFSLGDNVEVHCSDLNRDWVTTTKLNTPFAQTFFLDDDCTFPYKDEFADIVVADHSFVSYLGAERLGKSLDEISRVLRPGGYVFVNSISMELEFSEIDTLKIHSPKCTQRTGGTFVFNEHYFDKLLPTELIIKSLTTNSAFDFFVLQKVSK